MNDETKTIDTGIKATTIKAHRMGKRNEKLQKKNTSTIQNNIRTENREDRYRVFCCKCCYCYFYCPGA